AGVRRAAGRRRRALLADDHARSGRAGGPGGTPAGARVDASPARLPLTGALTRPGPTHHPTTLATHGASSVTSPGRRGCGLRPPRPRAGRVRRPDVERDDRAD